MVGLKLAHERRRLRANRRGPPSERPMRTRRSDIAGATYEEQMVIDHRNAIPRSISTSTF